MNKKKDIVLPFQLGSIAQSGAPTGGLLSNREPTRLGFLAIAVPSFLTLSLYRSSSFTISSVSSVVSKSNSLTIMELIN